MAWTATLISKTRDSQGRIVVVVQLTDGTVTVTDTYSTDTAPSANLWLTRQSKDRAAQLDANAAYVASLPAAGTPIDLTVNTAPTAAELAEQQWIADYRLLKKMVSAVDDGLILDTNTQLVNLRTKVKTNFLPAYIAHVR